MKRKGNLYQDIYKFDHIMKVYKEIRKNCRNKKKVLQFETFQCYHLFQIYKCLLNKSYQPGAYHVFTIKEPKERVIMSQKLEDKIVNHLVARYILMPALLHV